MAACYSKIAIPLQQPGCLNCNNAAAPCTANSNRVSCTQQSTNKQPEPLLASQLLRDCLALHVPQQLRPHHAGNSLAVVHRQCHALLKHVKRQHCWMSRLGMTQQLINGKSCVALNI